MRHLRGVLIRRRDAEEHEQARHLLLEEREVLRGAGQRAEADVLGAGGAPQRRQHALGQRRIVARHGIAEPNTSTVAVAPALSAMLRRDRRESRC